MRILSIIIVMFFISITAKSQSVTDEIMSVNFTYVNVSNGNSLYGIGMAVHDFDQDDWAFRTNYENFLLADLTYLLISNDYDRLSWGKGMLSHGLIGDLDLRLNVANVGGAVISAGLSATSYYLAGSGITNGNYYAMGPSLGADLILADDFGLFSNLQFNFPVIAKNPNKADLDDKPLFTQFQLIAKYGMFSLDYDLIAVDGNTRNDFRFSFWFDF